MMGRSPHGSSRALAFCAVSSAGFLLQTAAFAALIAGGTSWLVATALAVELAVLHNFAWHSRWTWRDRIGVGPHLLRRLVAFNLTTGLTSLAGNLVCMLVLVGMFGVHPLAAVPLAVACTSLANYLASDRWVFRVAVVVCATGVCLAPAIAEANGPRRETLEAWQSYVAQVEGRLAAETSSSWLSQTERRQVLQGQPFVAEGAPRGAPAASEVPGGTLQHWRGAVFVAGVTTDELVRTLRMNPPAQEGITRARLLEVTPDSVTLYLRLVYRKIVTVTYDTEHHVEFRSLGAGAARSRSLMTRVREVEAAETARERHKAPGSDRGFLWRLNSYARYSDVPGGVLVEIESLTLSRDVPWIVRPVAGPVIDSLARESMTRALEGVRAQGAARSSVRGQVAAGS